MSKEIEIEKTYLAKFLPNNLVKCKSKEMLDIYIPKESKHAKLRIRKSGDSYVITKKSVISEGNASTQLEESIKITPEEFKAFLKIGGNIIKKTRYFYPYKDYVAEIDVFAGKLKGLVLIDFEFKNHKQLKDFVMPDFCLIDVTEEDTIAGGVLSHQSIISISAFLKKLAYKKILL
jgi:adenylate cyclase